MKELVKQSQTSAKAAKRYTQAVLSQKTNHLNITEQFLNENETLKGILLKFNKPLTYEKFNTKTPISYFNWICKF